LLFFIITFNSGSNKAKIDNVSKLSPKWASKTDNFTGLFGYASKLSATDKKKADQVRANLERYLEEITRAYDTIKGYNREQQENSKLWAEVSLGFVACERWMQNVKIGREPRDLEASLVRKTGRLQSYIILEALEQLSDVSKDYERQIAQAKISGDVKHPLVYYENGRALMYQSKWFEAKQEFLKYENMLSVDAKRCRKPQDDNCYYYLSYCQEQINAQRITPENNPILSQNPYATVVGEHKNEYKAKHEAWVRQHKQSQDAIHSISRFQSTRENGGRLPQSMVSGTAMVSGKSPTDR